MILAGCVKLEQSTGMMSESKRIQNAGWLKYAIAVDCRFTYTLGVGLTKRPVQNIYCEGCREER